MDSKSMDDKQIFRILVMGERSVGKSTLLHHFSVGSLDYADITPTIGLEVLLKEIFVDDHRVVIQLYDVEGELSALASGAYRDIDASIFLYDVTEAKTLQQLTEWHKKLPECVSPADISAIPTFLVGNKSDKPNFPTLVSIRPPPNPPVSQLSSLSSVPSTPTSQSPPYSSPPSPSPSELFSPPPQSSLSSPLPPTAPRQVPVETGSAWAKEHKCTYVETDARDSRSVTYLFTALLEALLKKRLLACDRSCGCYFSFSPSSDMDLEAHRSECMLSLTKCHMCRAIMKRKDLPTHALRGCGIAGSVGIGHSLLSSSASLASSSAFFPRSRFGSSASIPLSSSLSSNGSGGSSLSSSSSSASASSAHHRSSVLGLGLGGVGGGIGGGVGGVGGIPSHRLTREMSRTRNDSEYHDEDLLSEEDDLSGGGGRLTNLDRTSLNLADRIVEALDALNKDMMNKEVISEISGKFEEIKLQNDLVSEQVKTLLASRNGNAGGGGGVGGGGGEGGGEGEGGAPTPEKPNAQVQALEATLKELSLRVESTLSEQDRMNREAKILQKKLRIMEVREEQQQRLANTAWTTLVVAGVMSTALFAVKRVWGGPGM